MNICARTSFTVAETVADAGHPTAAGDMGVRVTDHASNGDSSPLIVASDVTLLRSGLIAWLSAARSSWTLATTCATPSEMTNAAEEQPDAFIVVSDGLILRNRVLAGLSPDILSRLAVIMTSDNAARETRLVRGGVRAVLPPESSAAETFDALDQLTRGMATVPTAALDAFSRDESTRLTNRQREVLQLIAEGHSTGAVAERLFVAPITVRSHIRNISRQLGIAGGTRMLAARACELLEWADINHRIAEY